jgi:hypothetical protein
MSTATVVGNLAKNTENDTIIYPTTMEALKQEMLNGEQSEGVNYFMHGEQVSDNFQSLMDLARDGKAERKSSSMLPRRRLPKWFVDHQQWIYKQLEPKFQLYATYHVWHDCGKPLVKRLGENQQVHYPDHAAVSAKAYLAAGGNKDVANLIDQDMVCHHLRSVEETKDLACNNAELLGLMVTALCAMHVCAPSVREGNVCSKDLTLTPGFKIKFKRIEYYGKIMMRVLVGCVQK